MLLSRDGDSAMVIHTLRALKDNYCYLIHADGSDVAAAVDPSEAAPIAAALSQLQLKLGRILNTHHHHDHVGGNLELQRAWRCPVYCSQRDIDRIPGATRGFSDHDGFEFQGLSFQVLSIPGHTEGQIAYLVENCLFVGDTVFEMGCGRLFEGTALQMFNSLKTIQSLPQQTQLYFGHEYSETNARFAKSREPLNREIERRLTEVRNEIERTGHAAAPSIATESRVNPFFKAKSVDEFARLRELRNDFQ